MSSDFLPRTAVPLGITDPVERARVELKAALAAIEEKANVPRRVSQATDRTVVKARTLAEQNLPLAATLVVVGALAVGSIVWGLVRLYTR